MTQKDENIKWVPLPDLPGKVYADMVMEVLKEKEIPCYLRSLFGSGGIGVISGAGMAMARDKIMVPEEYYEEARQILEEMVDHF